MVSLWCAEARIKRGTLVRSVSSTGQEQEFLHVNCDVLFSAEDQAWLYFQDLEVARSFAATDVVDGCLVVTGGDTELGPTDAVEIIGGSVY